MSCTPDVKASTKWISCSLSYFCVILTVYLIIIFLWKCCRLCIYCMKRRCINKFGFNSCSVCADAERYRCVTYSLYTLLRNSMLKEMAGWNNVMYVFTMKTTVLSNPHVKLWSRAQSATCLHIWMLRCSMKQYSREGSVKATELNALCLNMVF